MNRYEGFTNFFRIVALVGAILLADIVLNKLQGLNIPPVLAFTLKGVSAVAVLQIAEYFSSWLFDSSSLVRRLALGADYLEGVWLDTVTDSNLFGLLNISYRNGQLCMNGEQYDTDGNVTASWDNFQINIDGRTVRALYRSPQYSNGVPSEILGFSTYIFSGPPGKAPEQYSGYFADSSAQGARSALRGFRIVDKEILKRLRSPNERHQALLSFHGHP